MKTNKILCMLLTLVILLGAFTIPVIAEENIKVVLNGTEVTFDVPPQIINGRTMVPLRTVFEALGAAVEWNEDTQTIFAVCGTCKTEGITHNVTMKIGDAYMYTYRAKIYPGELPPPGTARIELDVPPMLVGGRTLVPVRAVAEGLDAEVKWDGDTKTVIITKEETKPNSADSISESVTEYDYSSFIGEWQYDLPDSAWGIVLTVDDVRNNNEMSITLYGHDSHKNPPIVNNQVKSNDMNMSLRHNSDSYLVELTFYDDFILATVYSKERHLDDDYKKESELESYIDEYRLTSYTANPRKL